MRNLTNQLKIAPVFRWPPVQPNDCHVLKREKHEQHSFNSTLERTYVASATSANSEYSPLIQPSHDNMERAPRAGYVKGQDHQIHDDDDCGSSFFKAMYAVARSVSSEADRVASFVEMHSLVLRC
jgi:hypothetical protein